MNINSASEHRHAIVIGGSMAGLLAARVLADYYEQVTLVERDALGRSPGNRRGVPQGRHTHGLLASGCRVIETLFPGISNQLVAAGAVPGDDARDIRWFLQGACYMPFPEWVEWLANEPALPREFRSRASAEPAERALSRQPGDQRFGDIGRQEPCHWRKNRRGSTGRQPGGGCRRKQVPTLRNGCRRWVIRNRRRSGWKSHLATARDSSGGIPAMAAAIWRSSCRRHLRENGVA